MDSERIRLARVELAKRELARRQSVVSNPDQGGNSLAQYVSGYSRPALETAGLLGGALVGGGLGIPAGVGALATGAAGAGLGYAAGRQAANILDESLGLRQTPPLMDQMIDTASNVSEGATSHLAGLAISPALSSLKKFPTKMASAMLGPSQEAIEARLANPTKITNAKPYIKQAEELPKTLQTIKGHITKAFEKASGTLRNSSEISQGAIPKSQIQSILGDLQEGLKVHGSAVGQAKKGAVSSLESLSKDIDSILGAQKAPDLLGPSGQPLRLQKPDTNIPEVDIKRIIQSIDKNINWEDKAISETNASLTNARGRLDKILKEGNPKYAKTIKPVAKLEKLYNDARETFSIKNRTGEGLTHTDATISKLQSLPQERRGASQNVARRLQAATSKDLIDESRTYGLARQFESGITQGSRRVNLGGVIGGGVGAALGGGFLGGSVGTVAGGLTGAYLDKFGGQVAGRLIDKYVASNVTRQVSPLTRSIFSAFVARTESD